jgi:hypothetical protein
MTGTTQMKPKLDIPMTKTMKPKKMNPKAGSEFEMNQLTVQPSAIEDKDKDNRQLRRRPRQ